jgi:hypothetical protein
MIKSHEKSHIYNFKYLCNQTDFDEIGTKLLGIQINQKLHIAFLNDNILQSLQCGGHHVIVRVHNQNSL